MIPNANRSYNCKNEELPIICGFIALSLNRDLVDFRTFSPMFDAPVVDALQSKIDAAQELVAPKSETVGCGEIWGFEDSILQSFNSQLATI